MKKVSGNIHISYSVQCPYCDYYHDDYHDGNWFDDTVGSDFPIDDGYNTEREATCAECKRDFIITTFDY